MFQFYVLLVSRLISILILGGAYDNLIETSFEFAGVARSFALRLLLPKYTRKENELAAGPPLPLCATPIYLVPKKEKRDSTLLPLLRTFCASS